MLQDSPLSLGHRRCAKPVYGRQPASGSSTTKDSTPTRRRLQGTAAMPKAIRQLNPFGKRRIVVKVFFVIDGREPPSPSPYKAEATQLLCADRCHNASSNLDYQIRRFHS